MNKGIPVFLALAAWSLLQTHPVSAQNPSPTAEQAIGQACAAPPYRQFDFWLGEWRVRDSTGAEMGRSRVSRHSDGCALLEQWTGQNGVGGTSLNYFERRDSTWHQVWVGGDGTVLRIAGSLQEGAMQLMGEDRKTPKGTVRDRITWTPQPDGAVEQRWELSTDGGTTWTIGFVGYYRRK